MGPGDAAFIKAVIAFVLLAGTGMTGFWLWLRARARATSDPATVLDALREENAQLQADLNARMAELEERVDFAERRMVQREVARLPQPPQARTPV
ncbi:MAG TPA: hypothetical protein VI139_09210 [Gemmatimonadales bacterium]